MQNSKSSSDVVVVVRSNQIKAKDSITWRERKNNSVHGCNLRAGQSRRLDEAKHNTHTERADVNENRDTEQAVKLNIHEEQPVRLTNQASQEQRGRCELRWTYTLIMGVVPVVHLEGHAAKAAKLSGAAGRRQKWQIGDEGRKEGDLREVRDRCDAGVVVNNSSYTTSTQSVGGWALIGLLLTFYSILAIVFVAADAAPHLRPSPIASDDGASTRAPPRAPGHCA